MIEKLNHGNKSAIYLITPTLIALFAVTSSTTATCPVPNGHDARACDARPTRSTIAACIADAERTERCADHAGGRIRSIYLQRAASEYTKAAVSSNPHTRRAQLWLAHATVLDERIQDDPLAPIRTRELAKANEEKLRSLLIVPRGGRRTYR
jgi:hypothetical protein